MKVFVTGGAGFIGSHTVDAFLARGYEVMVYDNLSTGSRENVPRGVFLVEADLRHIDRLSKAIRDFRPDAICHLAAQPSASISWMRPLEDMKTNIRTTLQLLLLSDIWGGIRFVMASSAAVYAGRQYPLGELAPVSPATPYGVSKAAAEMYARLYIPGCTILRYSNVYGPRQIPLGENQLIPRALAHMGAGEGFEISGDGENIRDFIYVADVARANVAAIEQGRAGTFNVSTGEGRSVNQTCEILAAFMAFPGGFAHGPERPYEPRTLILDNAAIRDALDWRPQTQFADGLRETAEAWVNRYESR